MLPGILLCLADLEVPDHLPEVLVLRQQLFEPRRQDDVGDEQRGRLPLVRVVRLFVDWGQNLFRGYRAGAGKETYAGVSAT